VRLFVQTIGLFPVGTTVRLTTGQLAIVLEVPKDAVNFGRPVVKSSRTTRAVDYTLDLANDPSGAAISARSTRGRGREPPTSCCRNPSDDFPGRRC